MKKHLFQRSISTLISTIMGLSIIPFEGLQIKTNTFAADDTGSKMTDGILSGDVNCDGVIDNTDAESVLNVDLSDCPQADVNADGKLDQTDVDMIMSFTTREIDYFPVGKYYDEQPGFITRGEWIHRLVEGFEMSAANGSELHDFYSDLTDYEYGSEITLAANFGVFDVLGDKFNPNEFVTRDFAAHTMNYCLGYPNDITITFNDAESVYYDGDAQVAVNKGWFELDNKAFHPSLYVKKTESDLALKEMQETYKSKQIDENHKDVVEYSENVIRMTDAKAASIDGTTVTVIGSEKTVSEGDNFTFLIDGVEIIRKATSVWNDGETKTYTIETEDADEDSVLSCDVEGYAYIDYDNIEVLNPAAANILINGKSIKYSAPKTASSSGESFDKNIPLGDINFRISGSINNINVPYEWNKLSKFYLGFEADATISGTLAAQLTVEKTGTIDLLSIPVWGAAGFSANVVASATISVSGELTLTYSCSMNAGIEWTSSGGFRTVKNFTNQKFTMEATAKEKLGVQCAVTAKVFTKEIARIYVGIGEKGTLSTVSSSDSPVTCTQLSAYLYVEVGYKVNIVIAKFENSMEVINENNSPLRINIHWEDGKRVDSCTQGLEYSTITDASGGGSNGGGSSGGYVSGYGYSTGYSNGTHGPSWLGKYYASTIAFKELEPALVISEDRMLTDDFEVETDLIIQAKLDLNGHKLTADKNVYVGDIYDGWRNTGELVINKGTANIKGNLSEIDGSNIVMNNKTDRICVDGNVNLNGDTSFTAGTIEIKGDISGRLDSSDMHIVLLSGDGNQSISGNEYNDIHFNLLDINNSDSRTITVNNRASVESSTTIDGKTLHLICNESRNDKSYFSFGKLNADKLIIDGNVTLGSLEYRGSEITINGDLLGSDSITLNKTNVTINGDATTNGDFTLNGSSVTATGDYHHIGFLYMKNKNDKLNVGGDLHLEGTGDSIQDGVIDVKGDIRFSHVIDTYIFERYNELGGNNKLVLSGEDDVTIYMDGGRFNDIDFQNSDKRILNTDDIFRATSINCGTNPLNISTRNGVLELGAVTCSDFKVTGDSTIIGETKFNCSSITFDGDLSSGNNWDYTNIKLNGKPTNVNGVFTCNDELDLSGAVLNVDDLTLNGRLYFGKGSVNVKGDMTINDGGLYMQDEKDKLTILGDLNIPRNSYVNEPLIKSGTIECAGDITANGGSSCLRNCGNAVFVLNGEGEQLISITQSSHSYDNSPFFNVLNVTNSADRKIVLKGHLRANEINTDGDKLTIASNGGIINGSKINCDLDITGNVVIENETDVWGGDCIFDINGHTVDINGNLYQHSGELALNNGKLNISGDYLIVRDEDSAAQNISDGKLNMTHANDNLIVGGKFETMSNVDHSNLLTAGTMEIKGDFYQYDDGTEYAFPASGTNKAILSGSGVQKVTFESYDKSHFNDIELKQDYSQYSFSNEPCWNNLVSEDITTTSTVTTSIVSTTTTTVSNPTSSDSTTTTATDSTSTPSVSTTIVTTTSTTATTTTSPLASVKISKVGTDDVPLSGATLKLTGVKTDGITPIEFSDESIQVGSDGTLINGVGNTLIWLCGEQSTIVFAEDGTYTLKEVVAPVGYTLASDITFIVLGGKIVYNSSIVEIIKMIDERETLSTLPVSTTSTDSVTTTISDIVSTTKAEESTTTVIITSTANSIVTSTAVSLVTTGNDTEITSSTSQTIATTTSATGTETTASTTSGTATYATSSGTTASATGTGTTASTSQTTAASSTGEQGTTTTETKPVEPDKNLGDMNNDGKVDAKDASAILVAYSKASTGEDDGLTDTQRAVGDVNDDGKVDAKDASTVLSYYALVSTATGDVPTLLEFARPKVS